jgi:hypothetical protein
VAASIAAAFGFQKIIGGASNVEETMNKFNIVFGESSDAVKEWSDGLAADIGRSQNLVASFVAANQDLFIPIGFDFATAEQLSKTVASLAFDLASFNNLQDEQTFGDLQAALTGSGEVMKKYGVIVSEAAVKQELLNQGLNPATATEAQKVYARLEIILRGTTAAQGDALRSMNGFANQWKRLTGIIDDRAAALGSKVLPLVTSGVKYLSSAAEQLSPWLESVAGMMAFVAGDGAGAAKAFIFTGTAILVAATAYRAITLASQAYAKAAIFAQLLTGPKGWAVLAVSLSVAAVATATLTSEFEKQNEAVAAAAGSTNDAAAAAAMTANVFKQSAPEVKSYAAEMKKLSDEYATSVIPKNEQLRNELEKMSADWQAATAAGEQFTLTWSQLENLKLSKLLDASGWKSAFESVTNELRILRGEITETELQFEQMAAAGVDPDRIQQLREAQAERDRLTQEQADAAQVQSDRQARRKAERDDLLATKNEVLNSLATPLQKSVGEFAAKAAEVRAAVDAGILSPDQAKQYLESEQQKLIAANKPAERDQVISEAIDVRGTESNRMLAGLLNRAPAGGDPALQTNALLLQTNVILNDVKRFLAQTALETAEFGSAG